MLHLFLTSPHGHAHLRTSLPAPAEWLKLTDLLVPAGREGEELDLDLEVSRLLYGAAWQPAHSSQPPSGRVRGTPWALPFGLCP